MCWTAHDEHTLVKDGLYLGKLYAAFGLCVAGMLIVRELQRGEAEEATLPILHKVALRASHHKRQRQSWCSEWRHTVSK